MTNVYGGKIQIVTLADGSVRKLRPEVRLEHPLIFSEDGKNIFFVPYVRNDSQAVKLYFASIDGYQYHASGLMLPRGSSEERRVGQECIWRCRSGWSAWH